MLFTCHPWGVIYLHRRGNYSQLVVVVAVLSTVSRDISPQQVAFKQHTFDNRVHMLVVRPLTGALYYIPMSGSYIIAVDYAPQKLSSLYVPPPCSLDHSHRSRLTRPLIC